MRQVVAITHKARPSNLNLLLNLCKNTKMADICGTVPIVRTVLRPPDDTVPIEGSANQRLMF